MNDDVHPSDTPSAELVAVSAILDGTATADERALVEGSPDLSAMLDELRSHRDAIASVDVPAARREGALAAALVAFDELHAVAAGAAGAAVATANVVSLDRRRRLYRVVTAAAAAIVIVVVGVAALNNRGSTDDDSSTMSDAAATSAKASPDAESAGGADEATDDAVALSDAAPAETLAPAMSGGAPLPVEADASATEPPAATDTATEPPMSTIGAIPGPADVPLAIGDDAALADFAARATSTRQQGIHPCVPAGSEVLGQVTYQGQLADVGRALDDGEITAYAVDDCSVLTTVRP